MRKVLIVSQDDFSVDGGCVEILRASSAHKAIEMFDKHKKDISLVFLHSDVPWWDGTHDRTHQGCLCLVEHLERPINKPKKNNIKLVVVCSGGCGRCSSTVKEDKATELISRFLEKMEQSEQNSLA